ncbi:MAG: peptidylprolyl isomerase [Candidatus Gastranaerophilales bacterium]|nr:peptidylprolyl isomerase [Candidatus Gastranaerophilales bacterium]
MKLSKILIASALVTFGLTGCNLDKSAIIKVNDVSITKAQYEDMYKKETAAPQYKLFGNSLKDPENIMSLMIKDRLVNELIFKELINQEIKKREITVSADEIKARKAEIIEKIGSKEKFEELLKNNGVSQKQFTEDVENEIKMDKLIEQTNDTRVTEKDAKQFYNENKPSFDYPERVRASHILIEVNPAQIKQEIIAQDKKGELTSEEINKKTQEAVDAKMKFAKDVREQAVKNPDSFAELAKQYSDDKATADKGGDLGFFPKDAMVKPFADAAFKLKPGTVSEIVVTDFGNHIIIVTDKAKAGIQPFDKVKEEIMAYLEQKNKVDALKNILDGLKAQAKIDYVDPGFDVNKIQEQIKQKSKEQEEAMKAAKKEAKADKPADKPAKKPDEEAKKLPPKDEPVSAEE